MAKTECIRHAAHTGADHQDAGRAYRLFHRHHLARLCGTLQSLRQATKDVDLQGRTAIVGYQANARGMALQHRQEPIRPPC